MALLVKKWHPGETKQNECLNCKDITQFHIKVLETEYIVSADECLL